MEKVLVATFESDALVRILTPPVRDVLKANSDLTTVVMDRLIIVYDRSKAGGGFRSVTHGAEYSNCQIVSPQDWPRFHQFSDTPKSGGKPSAGPTKLIDNREHDRTADHHNDAGDNDEKQNDLPDFWFGLHHCLTAAVTGRPQEV